jgi:hypothetical protein
MIQAILYMDYYEFFMKNIWSYKKIWLYMIHILFIVRNAYIAKIVRIVYFFICSYFSALTGSLFIHLFVYLFSLPVLVYTVNLRIFCPAYNSFAWSIDIISFSFASFIKF